MSKRSVTEIQQKSLTAGTATFALPLIVLAMAATTLTGCTTINAIPVARVPGEILAVEFERRFR